MLPYVFTFITFALAFYCYLVAQLAFIPPNNLNRYAQAPKSAIHIVALACYHGVWLVWFLDPQVPSIANLCHGLGLFTAGAWLSIWARNENEWFVPYIAVPPSLCRTGPYKWIAHPGYLGFALMAFGTALMLGSWLCYLPMLCYWALLLLRAEEENDLLNHHKDEI